MFFEIAATAFGNWLDNHASLRAASLAYFIILPLPSLFVIIMLILSQFYGQTESFQTLIEQISTVVGPAVANLIQQILETVTTPFTSVVTSIITVVFTSIGAIGAFGVLQNTMNEIWGVSQKKLNGFQKLKKKIGPFFLISGIGLIAIIWTGITAVLIDLITTIIVPFASNAVSLFVQTAQIVLSFGLGTLLFAIIFKQIPDLPIKWKDVKLAAIFTGLVFTITNYVIGFVLELFTVTSLSGAAGAVMILLIWIYLITQLIIYGVAFSKVYSEKVGSYSVKNQTTMKKTK